MSGDGFDRGSGVMGWFAAMAGMMGRGRVQARIDGKGWWFSRGVGVPGSERR